MLENQIIEEIQSAWVTVATSRNMPDVANNVPNADDLKTLLEVTFLASMKVEEGVSIQARLMFFPNATTASLQQAAGWLDALSFSQSIPLTAESIRKVARAFNQTTTAIAVSRDGDVYQIIGAIFYGRPLSRLDDAESARGRPHVLTLSTRRAGSVAVGHGDSVIGRFENGQFSLAKAESLASRILVPHIIKTISTHEEYPRFQGEYWYLYRSCLQRLYTTAAAGAHGGTIAWIPTAQLSGIGQHVQAGIELSTRQSGSHLAGLALQRSMDTAVSRRWVGTERKDLTDYLDALSQLCFVDGALLIDDFLRPVRFACHFAAPKWDGEVREGPLRDTVPGEMVDTQRLGTRHQSAINFAAAHPGVVVFVISEDGPVRTICRFQDDVFFWPDNLNTVFVDQSC
jgi:hypothetical protein